MALMLQRFDRQGEFHLPIERLNGEAVHQDRHGTHQAWQTFAQSSQMKGYYLSS
jgi:hypothetical protein